MSLRDSNLDFEMAKRKATPESLEKALKNQIKIFDSVKDTHVGAFMPGGSLFLLSKFAKQNTAVLGYTMYNCFRDALRPISPKDIPRDCTLHVSFSVKDLVDTKKSFTSNTGTIIYDGTSRGVSHKRVDVEVTGYGVQFDVEVTWEFRTNDPNNGVGRTCVFEQRVVVNPKVGQINPIRVEKPPAQEFDIGAVVNILHDNPEIGPSTLQALVDLPYVEMANLPRHNTAVKRIEMALVELGRVVDVHVRFLAQYMPGAVTCWSLIEIPWSLCRVDKIPAEASDATGADVDSDMSGDEYMHPALVKGLDQFHLDQRQQMVELGSVAILLQQLMLIKSCSAHFKACYASIDHVMVRSFMEGIGAQNARLFENHKSLDSLLWKIGKYQMDRDNICLEEISVTTPGCTVKIDIKIPGTGYYQPLHAIPCENKAFKGELCFGGGTGVKVMGKYTRYLFMVPTESNMMGSTMPSLEFNGCSEFNNMPVFIVLGVPDGARTLVKAIFLLVDGWCAKMAIKVGAIPSQAAFEEAVSVLPTEFADFANAIRACDLAQNGLDVQVIEARGLIADAIGVKELDLMGDPEWLQQLICLMRGGASLQSISQVDQRDVEEKGWDKADSPTYDLQKLKSETDKLMKRMHKQGLADHYVAPSSPSPVYRSMGGETSTFCSLGASAEEPGGGCGEGGDDDAAIGELSEGMARVLSDDTDFMKKILTATGKLRCNKSVFGAKLDMPDPEPHCLFAKCKFPDGVTQFDLIAPGKDAKWTNRPALKSASETLKSMLRAYSGPVPTTRITVFGVLTSWESNVIDSLMSGGSDPSKMQLDVARVLKPLQKS